jgi:Glycoside hydrolase family 44
MRKFLICAAAILATGWLSVCAARAQTNEVIYSSSLQNGWQNWSWASVNLACTSPVLTGYADSISVSCTNYTALYLHQSPADSTPFTNLTFWLNGGASGGQVLSVTGTLNGGNQTVYTLPALAANTWTQFTVSLASMGVADSADFDGIWIWNDNGITIPTFYVDDIVLVAGPPPGPNPTNFIGVDVGTNRNPISPMIYGVASATSNELLDLNFTMNRLGGNEETTYNWQINAHGKGADYYFESYPDSSATLGESADSFVANSKGGRAQPLITVSMIGWTPKLGPGRAILPSYAVSKYGPQTGSDPYFTNAGNGISVTNNTPITWNDPNDSYTSVDTNFEAGYVQHLTNTWGTSSNGGVRYYIMDNEHSLWSSTHQDIHPVGPTMQEILGKITAYASMVKKLDPGVLVAGPEEWGWSGYLYSGYDQQWAAQHNNYDPAQYPDRTTNGGWDYMPWLLNQLHEYNVTNGQRLLDYFTLHCYPQEGDVSSQTGVSSATETLRNQSTRQFWDTNYVDPSWINSVIMLIPRMQNWVATYYPGTKIGVTEYNWGAEPYINGATAQADILGIFGREGLDLATRWTTPDPSTPTYLAMKMYRNYDSEGHTFGDTSVLEGGPNPDNIAVFAAQRSSDDALTLMVVSKYLTGTAPIVINVTNFTGTGTAHVWQLNASNVIAQLSDVPYSGGTLQTIVPGQSVSLFVLPASSKLLLSAGAPRTDGQFAFSVGGEIGQNFLLQSSPDLIHWSSVSTNTLASTNSPYLLPVGASTEFYRAMLSQ